MRKSSLIISSTTATILMFAGCGGGGNSDNTINTGTGYYVDSGIEGVNYTCGSQTGMTGKEGKFIFEKGQGCSFSIGGITLRTVGSNQLADGKKVLENDLEVARFLQSVDTDGNPDNGIQISPEVLEVLHEALQEYKSGNEKTIKDVVKDDMVLENVVSIVENKVEDFQGKVVDEEQAKEHLEKTQTEITKELLAGKTFYLVGRDTDIMFNKMVFNNDATFVEMSGIDGQNRDETFTLGMTINADKIIFSDTPDKYRKIIEIKDKYLVMQGYKDDQVDDESVRLYYSESDAQAYFDSLNAGSSGGSGESSADNPLSASALKAHFSGKTFYIVDDQNCDNPPCENAPEISPVIFNADATTLQIGTNDTPWTITIEDGKLVDHEGDHYIDEITDTYVKGHDSYGEFIFYVNRADAQAALEALALGQYLENGKIVKITRGSANMNHSNPPIFQFNLKHDIGDDRDMVQINTQYKSQAEFDDALVNNKITLNS